MLFHDFHLGTYFFVSQVDRRTVSENERSVSGHSYVLKEREKNWNAETFEVFWLHTNTNKQTFMLLLYTVDHSVNGSVQRIKTCIITDDSLQAASYI